MNGIIIYTLIVVGCCATTTMSHYALLTDWRFAARMTAANNYECLEL